MWISWILNVGLNKWCSVYCVLFCLVIVHQQCGFVEQNMTFICCDPKKQSFHHWFCAEKQHNVIPFKNPQTVFRGRPEISYIKLYKLYKHFYHTGQWGGGGEKWHIPWCSPGQQTGLEFQHWDCQQVGTEQRILRSFRVCSKMLNISRKYILCAVV